MGWEWPINPPSRSVVDPEESTSDSSLWRDFADAATSEAFYRGWLAIQCRLIPGVGTGVIFAAPSPGARFAPAASWPDGRRPPAHLGEAAERALSDRRGIVLKREAADETATPARDRYDVAYPIQAGGDVYGVVALDLAPRPERDLEGVLRQLQWGAGWVELLAHRLGARTELAPAEAARQRLQTVLDLLTTALGHERFYGAASAFVTALATRLGCERVSIGFVKRGRARVRAVSHSAHFGKQTNLVRAIGAAMDEAIDQQGTVVYPAPAGREPRVVRAHTELARQAEPGAICTIPLIEGRRFVGALTLERSADRPFDAMTIELSGVLAAVVGAVLEIHRRDDRWLATKAVDSGWRHLKALIGPGHAGLKLGVVALTAVVLLLALAQGDYRVSARTVMEARTRLASVAPFAGYIKEAPTRAGDLVRRNQLLAVLDDRGIRLERLKWLSQAEQLVRQRDQAMARRDAAAVQILGAQVEQARAQVALLDDQLSRTRLLAPFDGSIVLGDLSQAIGAPVERGQVLFEVAPLADYRVALQVDERDVTDIVAGQRGELLLTAWPADAVPFTVETITPVSTAREGRNYFRVEARLDRTPERLRPGMEGVAKVAVGRRLLAWIWTRQAVDWVRLKAWAWSP
ncbi:MAG: HlyD family efflux transporter periplasmic adaptor subunit [Candidatus Rokuibacteriota bacterium]